VIHLPQQLFFILLGWAWVYKTAVPGQRHPDQTQIAFALSFKLSAAIEEARKKAGEDRSTFIRKAAVLKIRKEGVEVEDEWASAPDRVGKGGRKTNSAKAQAVSDGKAKQILRSYGKTSKPSP
jgi:hypothetical protein